MEHSLETSHEPIEAGARMTRLFSKLKMEKNFINTFRMNKKKTEF